MTTTVNAAGTLRRLGPAVFVVGIFSWVFFLPVSHNEILYPLFGLLGLAALIVVILRNPLIDVHVWAIAFLVAALGIYGDLLGIENPDPIFTFTVFLIAPAMYLLCVAAASVTTLRYLFIAAVIGTLLVSVVLLVFIGGEAGIIQQVTPHWLISGLDMKATFRGGASQARSWGLSSLNALGPIWMASLLVRKHALLPPWWLRLVCAALALATAILSARDSITLVMILAPFIALLLRVTLLRTSRTPIWLPRRPWEWVAIGAVVLVAAVLVIPRLIRTGPIASVFSAIGSFFGVASASGDANQSIRSDEASYLLQGWATNPIFGAGFRALVPGYQRASEIPWSLELQYHVLLFNVGLIGIVVAAAIVVAGILFVRKAVVANPEFMPVLLVSTTGGIAMLIANATNPYLVAPGHQWAVFLPVAVASVAIRTAAARLDPIVGGQNALRGSMGG